MRGHIEWFEAVLHVTIGVYFHQQGFENASVGQLRLPLSKWLEESTKHSDITFEERVIVMLALMPHIKPQALDTFFLQNGALDRQFTQFGGWKGLSHGGFLPTGETAVFIIAGDDPIKRCEVVRMFQRDHWFYTLNILRLEGANEGEPFLRKISKMVVTWTKSRMISL